jgi:CheY-like chemotaxis protein
MLPANVAIGQENERAGLTVEGDAEQLKQVVVNLATNAAAAMPDGGSLELRTGRRGKGWVWLEVSDTGVGIPAELQEKVFEPFFTTKDPGTSTGLGLTVVKEIVSRHRGRVTLESREGVGTTFKIELPGAAAGAKPAERPVAGKVPTAPGHGQGERVLLVEDEVAAREGLTEMLKMLDYRVTSVESGEMAGLLPSEPAFDLLLADVMLPGATGTELARGLKERWPALRVLLMSGYTKDEADRLTAPPTGTRFLQKPFDMATLAHEVRAALDEGKP